MDDFSEDKELWSLLSRQKKVELSPFFARNVIRQTRSLSSWFDFSSLKQFKWAFAGALGLIAVATVFLNGNHAGKKSTNLDGDELVEFFDFAAGLDKFAVSEEVSAYDLTSFQAN